MDGIRLSSTVLILRQCGGEIQVLMQKRADRMAFAAQWVFPGGTVSAADGDPRDDLHGALRRAAVRESVWRRVNMVGGRDNPDLPGCQRGVEW